LSFRLPLPKPLVAWAQSTPHCALADDLRSGTGRTLRHGVELALAHRLGRFSPKWTQSSQRRRLVKGGRDGHAQKSSSRKEMSETAAALLSSRGVVGQRSMYFASQRSRVVRRGVSISRRSPGKILLLALSAFGLGGCGASPEQPHVEVPTRKQIPIPVCSQQLTPLKRSASGKAMVRSLDPEQWMNVLIPAYTVEKGLGDKDVDCTGHYVFANESLRGGVSAKGWPRALDAGGARQRAGPEGMRVLWLTSSSSRTGTRAGRSRSCAPSTIARRSTASAASAGPRSPRWIARSHREREHRRRRDDDLPRPGRLPQARAVLPGAARSLDRVGERRSRAHRRRPLRAPSAASTPSYSSRRTSSTSPTASSSSSR
jgi:hypothetical protein